MKKIIMLALALSLFMGVSTAKADEPFDMTALTCDEVLSDAEGLPYTIFWVSGYIGAKVNEPVISGEIMEALTQMVGDMCSERPDATLGQVMDNLMQR